MATFHAANTGAWQTAASWTENSGYPGATDTVIFGAGFSGTITLGQANACANLDMTGNAGTLAFATYALTVSTSTKLYGTMTATSGNNLTITGGGVQLLGNCGSATTTIYFTTAGQTLTSGGYTWGGKLTIHYAGTFVLSENWVNTGLFAIDYAVVLNQTTNETLTCNGGLYNNGGLLSGTVNIIIGGTGGTISQNSGSYSIANNLTFNCTSATIGVNFGYRTGTMTYTAGTITTSNSTLYIFASCTLTGISNISWNNFVIYGNSETITMNSDLNCTGTLKVGFTNPVITGGNINCGTFYVNYFNGTSGLTLDAGTTLTIADAIQIPGDFSGVYVLTLKSGTPSSYVNLVYNGTAANCQVSKCTFTDIDASGGNPIRNFIGGTLTRTKNIWNLVVADFSPTGVWGAGAVAQETGANARGGSGSAVKLTPTALADYMYWTYLVPTTASTAFVLNLYHMITSGFNGSMTVTVYDTDNTTVKINAASVTLVNDGAYHLYQTASISPTATGFCRVVLKVLNGAVAGSVYIDDISLS